MSLREFDIVLYGAAGFTGRQAVRYFARNAPAGVRWAIAGRDRSKLERLDAGVPFVVAGSEDRASLDTLAQRTQIIVSTAGPFELYSDALVAACVRFGSHYVDISGETAWARSLIDRYHDQAATDGTRIIPSCGFDSVPSDMGATWIARQLGNAVEVKAYYDWKGGQPNGGTIATGFHVASSNRAPDLFLLSPGINRPARPLELDPAKASYDRDAQTWVTPFIMSPINTRVVRRSCALLGLDFAYQEYAKARGAMQAYALAAAGELLKWSLESPAVRRAIQRISPQPGTGPSEKAMDDGWFRCEFFARSADGPTSRALVSGEGDPANRVTVKCLCESAFTLACNAGQLPHRAGVLTPSTGLGRPLLDRLIAKGIQFSAADCRR